VRGPGAWRNSGWRLGALDLRGGEDRREHSQIFGSRGSPDDPQDRGGRVVGNLGHLGSRGLDGLTVPGAAVRARYGGGQRTRMSTTITAMMSAMTAIVRVFIVPPDLSAWSSPARSAGALPRQTGTETLCGFIIYPRGRAHARPPMRFACRATNAGG